VQAASIPAVPVEGGTLRVIAGQHGGIMGPVSEIAVAPLYLDLQLQPGSAVSLPVPAGHAAFCHLFDGGGEVGGEQAQSPTLLVLGDGDHLRCRAGETGMRLLLAAGRPLREPVARGGPFVMNTRQEIKQAFLDY